MIGRRPVKVRIKVSYFFGELSMLPKVSMRPETYKQHILDIIFKRFDREDCVIFLFGSQVSGEALDASDLDIGLLSCREIPALHFVETAEDLNRDVPFLRKIDLVDFASLAKKVREQALREIRLWHAGKNCKELLKELNPAQ